MHFFKTFETKLLMWNNVSFNGQLQFQIEPHFTYLYMYIYKYLYTCEGVCVHI